jgi:RNA polymerase sigma-70 factor (ECF subfamily)
VRSASPVDRPPAEYDRRVGERGGGDDAELEAAFAAGGDDVLRRAYDRYGALVYTLSLRMVDRTTAADVTQEVFVAAWRFRRRYDPGKGGLAAWLAAITRNKLVDHLRAEGRRVPQTRLPADDPAAPAAGLDHLADRLLLADALATLGPRQRAVVELSFYEGLSASEIAERRELPVGTVKSDLRRSIERLRRHITRPDGEADGG